MGPQDSMTDARAAERSGTVVVQGFGEHAVAGREVAVEQQRSGVGVVPGGV